MWNIKPLNILIGPEITSLIKCFSTELKKINYHEKSIWNFEYAKRESINSILKVERCFIENFEIEMWQQLEFPCC